MFSHSNKLAVLFVGLFLLQSMESRVIQGMNMPVIGR